MCLAVCLLALRAGAFLVQTPHLRVHAGPGAPGGRDARALPLMMSAPAAQRAKPGIVQGLQRWLTRAGTSTPNALSIISRWKQDAAAELAAGLEEDLRHYDQAISVPLGERHQAMAAYNQWQRGADKQMEQVMHVEGMLDYIRDQITKGGTVEQVFGLSTSGKVEDIQAIATITTLDLQDGSKLLTSLMRRQGMPPQTGTGAVGAGVGVVVVSGLVAVPRADRQKGVGAELLRRINAYASSRGRLISLTPSSNGVAAYYKRLGFVWASPSSGFLVYGGRGLEYSPAFERFRMIALDF